MFTGSGPFCAEESGALFRRLVPRQPRKGAEGFEARPAPDGHPHPGFATIPPYRMTDKAPEISRDKQKLLYRVRRLRGQFAAVERALTAGDECADILMLLAAIRGGVNGLMAEILEDHIRLHMMNPDQKMESPEELGEDLISLVRAYLK